MQFTKQPAESYTISMDYTDRLPIGVTLSSRVVLAAHLNTTITSTAASASEGSSTIQTVANVGSGAIITINPNTDFAEVVLVQTATGANPCTCQLMSQLSHTHASGTPVTYFPGVSDEVFGVTTAIVGNQAQAKVQNGQHGNRYQLMFLTTLSNGDIIEDDV